MGIINGTTLKVAAEITETVVPKLAKEAALVVDKALIASTEHVVETKLTPMVTDAITHGLFAKGGAAPVKQLGYIANNLGHTPAPRVFADIQGTVLKVKGPFPGHNGLMHEIMRLRVEKLPTLAVQGSVVEGASKALLPEIGQEIEVANDVTMGSMVPKTVVGQQVAVRGVVYQDGSKLGIHWTHAAKHNQPGGFIKTLIDGHIFQ